MYTYEYNAIKTIDNTFISLYHTVSMRIIGIENSEEAVIRKLKDDITILATLITGKEYEISVREIMDLYGIEKISPGITVRDVCSAICDQWQRCLK